MGSPPAAEGAEQVQRMCAVVDGFAISMEGFGGHHTNLRRRSAFGRAIPRIDYKCRPECQPLLRGTRWAGDRADRLARSREVEYDRGAHACRRVEHHYVVSFPNEIDLPNDAKAAHEITFSL